jgi:preprotein translocase subunit SecE
VAFGFILVREMKTYLKIQMVTFVIALLGILAHLGADDLLPGDIRGHLQRICRLLHGGSQPLPICHQSGETERLPVWGVQLVIHMGLHRVALLVLAFGAQSVSFAGEIRKVGRSQLMGTTGAVALAAMLMFIIVWLSDLVMGWEFLGAIAYLSWEVPEAVGPITPWFHFLASLLTQNPVLLGLIILGWIFWSYYWVPVNMLYVTRVVFPGPSTAWLRRPG